MSSDDIVGIDFYDGANASIPKNIFELFIYRKDELEDIKLRLVDYGHAEEVIDKILIYTSSIKNMKELGSGYESRFEH